VAVALDRLGALDGPAVRRWVTAGLAGLTAAQEEIDGLNVYPIPDSDTGTNLARTLRAGADALGRDPSPELGSVCQILADAVLRGACGNSGTILSQLLRGLADATSDAAELDPAALAAALTHAAGLARAALARPVEGTILSVADAAAAAAAAEVSGSDRMAEDTGPDKGAGLLAVVRAAHQGAALALARTPEQLAALGGRVDAGGRGLVVLLAALETVVSGADDRSAPSAAPSTGDPAEGPDADDNASLTGHPLDHPVATERPSVRPSHEVMYLLDTGPRPGTQPAAGTADSEGKRIADLRLALDRIGDSVLVVGGGGLWQVHAHVDDVGAALELGLAAGRPHRVRITAFGDGAAAHSEARPDERSAENVRPSDRVPAAPAGLRVVAIVDGPGLTDLLTTAGAEVVAPAAAPAGLTEAVERLDAPIVAVLPGSADGLAVAQQLADVDQRVRAVRSWSCVQVIAALAVHDLRREPEADLLQMATAAAACRHGLVEVAEGDGVTSVGVCHRGDVLGHVNGDVAVIGQDLETVAAAVVDLLLGGGGELVTLVAGRPAEAGLADRVAAAVHSRRPDVDVTTYDGGQPASYLVVGVE
jgi:DAK2 domain fusion protein YloV